MNVKKTFIVIFAALALMLTGCGTTPAATSAPSASPSLATPVEAPATSDAPAPEENSMLKTFSEAMTWDDGISISVSAPTAFNAGEYAAGVTPGLKQVVFKIVLTNGTKTALKPSVYSTVSSGGSEATSIFDTGNPLGDISGGPKTAILPGKTVQWLEAYSVADAKDITFQISPSFSHEDAIFTLK